MRRLLALNLRHVQLLSKPLRPPRSRIFRRGKLVQCGRVGRWRRRINRYTAGIPDHSRRPNKAVNGDTSSEGNAAGGGAAFLRLIPAASAVRVVTFSNGAPRAENMSLPTSQSESDSGSAKWRRLLVHVAAVYTSAAVVSPLLGVVIYHLDMAGGWTSRSGLQFYSSHLFVLSTVPALLAGYVSARSKIRDTATLWIWALPAAMILVKWLTFPSATVLEGRSSEFLRLYFGESWTVPSTLFEAFRYSSRSGQVLLAHLGVIGPFYAGIAYALGTAGRNIMSSAASEKVQQ